MNIEMFNVSYSATLKMLKHIRRAVAVHASQGRLKKTQSEHD